MSSESLEASSEVSDAALLTTREKKLGRTGVVGVVLEDSDFVGVFLEDPLFVLDDEDFESVSLDDDDFLDDDVLEDLSFDDFSSNGDFLGDATLAGVVLVSGTATFNAVDFRDLVFGDGVSGVSKGDVYAFCSDATLEATLDGVASGDAALEDDALAGAALGGAALGGATFGGATLGGAAFKLVGPKGVVFGG
jgi:uncharacterized protein YjbI with pentapeptide repeats